MDKRLRPVPIGLTGEIYIGGDGVARGYLCQPELTAERFIQHQFRHAPKERLFKTGDQGRYQPDGAIEFLGRLDRQIKIRGFRVELGEIEAALTLHRRVREVVVLAEEINSGEKRLAAYVVPDSEQPPTVDDLRLFLSQQLPEYMVPSSFRVIDDLPLTPNGKVDRCALAALTNTAPEETVIGARNASEELVAEIWAEVLRVEHVAVDKNFFALGGDSLLAMQLISRVRQRMGVDLPLLVVFGEGATVAGMAAEIARLKVQKNADDDVANLLTRIEHLSENEAHELLKRME